jgi:hypothetical protein
MLVGPQDKCKAVIHRGVPPRFFFGIYIPIQLMYKPLRQDRGQEKQRLSNLMRHPRPARPAADGPDTAAALATGCRTMSAI